VKLNEIIAELETGQTHRVIEYDSITSEPRLVTRIGVPNPPEPPSSQAKIPLLSVTMTDFQGPEPPEAEEQVLEERRAVAPTLRSDEKRLIDRKRFVETTTPAVAAAMVLSVALVRAVESGSKLRFLQRSRLSRHWFVRGWAALRACTPLRFWRGLRRSTTLGDSDLWIVGSFACQALEKELMVVTLVFPAVKKIATHLEPFLKDYTKVMLQRKWNIFWETEKTKFTHSVEKTMESMKESAAHFHEKMKGAFKPPVAGSSHAPTSAVLPQSLMQWPRKQPMETANGHSEGATDTEGDVQVLPSIEERMNEIKAKLEKQMSDLQEQLRKLSPSMALPPPAWESRPSTSSRPQSFEEIIEHVGSLTNKLRDSVTGAPAPPPRVDSDERLVPQVWPSAQEPAGPGAYPTTAPETTTVAKTSGNGEMTLEDGLKDLLLDEEIAYEEQLHLKEAEPSEHVANDGDPMGFGNLSMERGRAVYASDDSVQTGGQTYFPQEVESDDGW